MSVRTSAERTQIASGWNGVGWLAGWVRLGRQLALSHIYNRISWMSSQNEEKACTAYWKPCNPSSLCAVSKKYMYIFYNSFTIYSFSFFTVTRNMKYIVIIIIMTTYILIVRPTNFSVSVFRHRFIDQVLIKFWLFLAELNGYWVSLYQSARLHARSPGGIFFL